MSLKLSRRSVALARPASLRVALLLHQQLRCAEQRRSYSASNSAPKGSRFYKYEVDVHGQLFLADTTPKNLTSCFKSIPFLNFFYARVTLSPAMQTFPAPSSHRNFRSSGGDEDVSLETDWDVQPDIPLEQAARLARAEGYHWLSPCQGEYNFVRASATPIVFRELQNDEESDNYELRWAGDFTVPFEPAALVVDPSTGYLYHPSPPSRSRAQLRNLPPGAESPYGPYSLIASAVVLEHLSAGLEFLDDGKGGSIRFQNREWQIGVLRPPLHAKQ